MKTKLLIIGLTMMTLSIIIVCIQDSFSNHQLFGKEASIMNSRSSNHSVALKQYKNFEALNSPMHYGNHQLSTTHSEKRIAALQLKTPPTRTVSLLKQRTANYSSSSEYMSGNLGRMNQMNSNTLRHSMNNTSVTSFHNSLTNPTAEGHEELFAMSQSMQQAPPTDKDPMTDPNLPLGQEMFVLIALLGLYIMYKNRSRLVC